MLNSSRALSDPAGASVVLEGRYLLAQAHGWQGIHAQTVFVFVGERRSRRAAKLGVSLIDGRLAAKTLHDALRAAGLAPERSVFLNLFHDHPAEARPCDNALQAVRSLAAAGAAVVGLGRRVQAALRCAEIEHVPLTHPAARGAIRARAAYQRHVREVLGLATSAQTRVRSRGSTREAYDLACAVSP